MAAGLQREINSKREGVNGGEQWGGKELLSEA